MKVDYFDQLIILTPTIQADSIVSDLKEICSKITTKNIIDDTYKSVMRGDEDLFTTKVAFDEDEDEEMFRNEKVADLYNIAIRLIGKSDGINLELYNLRIIFMQVSLLFCLQAKLSYSEKKHNNNLAWTFILDAIFWKNSVEKSLEFNEGAIEEVKLRARNNALKRVEKDPKQKDKSFVLSCWEAWQNKPASYKFKADFARDMLDKCEHLKSQKKIEDWCRDWEKAHLASKKLIELV
jgi:hypothetical protein